MTTSIILTIDGVNNRSRLAPFSRLIIPIFPIDIATGFIGFAVGFYLLLLAPAFFTGRKLYENSWKTIDYN